jgi:hypothetical protein
MVESNRGYLRYLMPQWGRRSWLSLTPEPERELPRLVATIRSGRRPPPEVVAAEEIRVSRLVLRRGEAAWLRYLHRVVELLDSDLSADPAVAGARARAIEVLANHHNLLLGLPGRAARRTAEDRVRLEALAARAAEHPR